jgi:hypothetical protein
MGDDSPAFQRDRAGTRAVTDDVPPFTDAHARFRRRFAEFKARTDGRAITNADWAWLYSVDATPPSASEDGGPAGETTGAPHGETPRR